MKKLYLSIFLFYIFTIIFCPFQVFAQKNKPVENDTNYINNNIYIETSIYTNNIIEKSSATSVRNETRTAMPYRRKSASKTYTVKNCFGQKLATFTLYASFIYNGSYSACTYTSYSSSVLQPTWRFTFKSASKFKRSASGRFTLQRTFPRSSITQTIKLKCNKKGKIT